MTLSSTWFRSQEGGSSHPNNAVENSMNGSGHKKDKFMPAMPRSAKQNSRPRKESLSAEGFKIIRASTRANSINQTGPLLSES